MRKLFKRTLTIFLGLLLTLNSCNNMIDDLNPKTKTKTSGTTYTALTVNESISIPSTDGTVNGVAIDLNGDGIVDGIDLDGNATTIELPLLITETTGLYSSDIDADGTVDFYFLNTADDVYINTASDNEGTDVVAVTNEEGSVTGFDSSENSTADIILSNSSDNILDAGELITVSQSDGTTSSTIVGTVVEDGIDLDGDFTTTEIVLVTTETAGAYSSDVDDDGIFDFYVINESGTVSINTKSDNTGTDVVLITTKAGNPVGWDTDATGISDISLPMYGDNQLTKGEVLFIPSKNSSGEDSTVVEAVALDLTGNGVVDGLDTDGDQTTIEIVFSDIETEGIIPSDIDGDGTTDLFINISDSGDVIVSTTSGGTANDIWIIEDGSGGYEGFGNSSGTISAILPDTTDSILDAGEAVIIGNTIGRAADYDGDDVIDSIDFDGDPSNPEVLIGTPTGGVYPIDINMDGTDDVFVNNSSGDIIVSTDGGTTEDVAILVESGKPTGWDLDDNTGTTEYDIPQYDDTVLTPGEVITVPSTDGSTEGTLSGVILDTNNDKIPDGIDLTGNTSPDIVITDDADGYYPAADLNSDGTPDFYVGVPAAGEDIVLTTTDGGTTSDVQVVMNDSGGIESFNVSDSLVGTKGPSGGYIFYDDEADGEDNIPGFRYLEAAPEDISTTKAWGTQYFTVSGADGTAIGSGIQNTIDIILGDSSTTNAAHACADYSIVNNGTTYDNWFLPSKDELKLMIDKLKVNDLDEFVSSIYWSSSEYSDSNRALTYDFRIYPDNSYPKSLPEYVRPIRAFNDSTIEQFTITFNIGDAASGSVPAGITGNFLSEVTIPGQGNLESGVLVFRGWNTESDGTGATYNGGTQLIPETGAITLFAIFSELAVGDIGPAGGYIFYDDEADSTDDIPGFRYLEAAPANISETKEWGSSDFAVSGADATDLGTGVQNTIDIIVGDSSTTNAAHACVDYSVKNNEIIYDDWFLPSKDELNAMYINLKVNDFNDLNGFGVKNFWSSSEESNTSAWLQYFSNANVVGTYKGYDNYIYVRPIRAFNNLNSTIEQFTITYNIGDATGTKPDSITGNFLSETAIPSQGNLESGILAFRGWNTASNGTGTMYNGGTQLIPETGAITLYAIFTEFVIGDIGPAGGYIFYDDEADSTDDIPGFRYLEAAPANIPETKDWGTSDFKVSGADGTAIGTGAQNTLDIIESDTASTDNAAHACADYSVECHEITYDDWFLPSQDELNAMYDNLQVNNLGEFIVSGSPYTYFSSSERSNIVAWVQDFYRGYHSSMSKQNKTSVRPVRAF